MSQNNLLHAILDSWDRNNTILLNLLRAIPEGPTVSQIFTHIHHERMISVRSDQARAQISGPNT
jgi:hypothetical protein